MKRWAIIFFLASMNGFADELIINGQKYYSNGTGPGGQEIPTPLPPPPVREAPQLTPNAPLESFGGGEPTNGVNENNQNTTQNSVDSLKEQREQAEYRKMIQEGDQKADEEITREVDDEFKKYEAETIVKIENLQTKGIAGDNNPQIIAFARDQIKATWAEYVTKMGLDSDDHAVLRLKIRRSLSTMNKFIIFDYLSKRQLKRAKRYFDSHRDEIDYTDLPEIYKKLRKYQIQS
jgi:hypothetical protein